MPLNGRIVKGRIDSIGSKPTLQLLNKKTTLRIDWAEKPEAWLEIDIKQLLANLSTTTTLTKTITTSVTTAEYDDEEDEDVKPEPAYSDFTSGVEPKLSPTQIGAYADWFRGPESDPMPPMDAFGPEKNS